MSLPFYVSWATGDQALLDFHYPNQSLVSTQSQLGVHTWNDLPEAYSLRVRNTSQARQIAISSTSAGEKLENIRFYLQGDESTLSVLMEEWPLSGCGLELSMDQGVTWLLFSRVIVSSQDGTVLPILGVESDPSTWIPLQASAVAFGSANGELLSYPPYDQAYLLLRLRVPSSSSLSGLFEYNLGIDFDVL